ncbi:MAG: hypothetical protein JNJ88_16355 [Planctomycetes bacterium]|nr:hypothetical protein [Planctomycetota bacterium]
MRRRRTAHLRVPSSAARKDLSRPLAFGGPSESANPPNDVPKRPPMGESQMDPVGARAAFERRIAVAALTAGMSVATMWIFAFHLAFGFMADVGVETRQLCLLQAILLVAAGLGSCIGALAPKSGSFRFVLLGIATVLSLALVFSVTFWSRESLLSTRQILGISCAGFGWVAARWMRP